MSLRNAFANLVTESVSGAIEAILQRRELTFTAQTLPYAKTISDAMRVNVENQPAVTLYPGNTSSGISGAVLVPTLFGSNATFTVDEREQQRLASEQNMNTVMQRWSIT
jgi:hypothetical protein